MPHVLIKYAHVLICISAGEGSRLFSAFHFKKFFSDIISMECIHKYYACCMGGAYIKGAIDQLN